MNKYIATFLLSALSICAVAQNYNSARVGLIKQDGEYSLSYPTTTIAVELLVEKNEVIPGVYARYAQKYLAMRAPLVAQTTYKIIDASISSFDGNSSVELTPKSAETEYAKLPADQYGSYVLAPEDAARDAAAAIFTIRNQRREIINGEAGEGYFGAGLKDAMDRLDVMEKEYLELFMGCSKTTQYIEKYIFKPSTDVSRYVISRFDAKIGVLPANDLTGTPVYMQFTALEMPDTSSFEADNRKFSKNTELFTIAAPTQCLLYNDSELIGSSVLSIFEFGKTIEIELSK
ncbi:MAG: DUF4831 family protein [Rikenellaceae bacterium]